MLRGDFFSASDILLAIFWGTSSVIWLSSFGYMLILAMIVRSQHRSAQLPGTEPNIAVVVPTLNEESLIRKKIEDIKRSKYPRDKINFIVVDGGSQDQTMEKVKEEISRGEKIRLIRLSTTQKKSDQINYVLEDLGEDIIVFSDVDSEMEPSCISELVADLAAAPKTAIVGATIKPQTCLLVERIHWWFLNYLWWLEGEAFFCAGISGVCFAVNRRALLSIGRRSRADDIHLGLAAGALGFRVRLSRRALATETRVPQTVKEFLQYRRRRGSCYAYEILRFPFRSKAPFRWRLARFFRLFQFLATPMMTVAAILSSLLLLTSGHWLHVILAFAAFLTPAIFKVFAFASQEGKPRRLLLSLATVRFLILFLASLFAMQIPFSGQGALGGKRI